MRVCVSVRLCLRRACAYQRVRVCPCMRTCVYMHTSTHTRKCVCVCVCVCVYFCMYACTCVLHTHVCGRCTLAYIPKTGVSRSGLAVKLSKQKDLGSITSQRQKNATTQQTFKFNVALRPPATIKDYRGRGAPGPATSSSPHTAPDLCNFVCSATCSLNSCVEQSRNKKRLVFTIWLAECCFTSAETLGFLGDGSPGRATSTFHTAPEL